MNELNIGDWICVGLSLVVAGLAVWLVHTAAHADLDAEWLQ